MFKKLFSFKKNTFEAFNQALKDLVRRKQIRRDTASIIEGALRLEDLQVRDVMIPRAKMVVIGKEDKFDQILPLTKRHSRFPVVDKSTDKVVGILLAKDLLNFIHQDIALFNIEMVLRPALFVPESKKLIKLLNEFRKKHSHMAVVKDEYGNMAGLVTIENILEQIVGDIIDESDFNEDQQYIHFYQSYAKQKSYRVNGLTPLEQFNHFFNTSIISQDFDTIGGIVMHAFGYVPKEGESTYIKNMLVEVVHADKRHIKMLQITTNS